MAAKIEATMAATNWAFVRVGPFHPWMMQSRRSRKYFLWNGNRWNRYRILHCPYYHMGLLRSDQCKPRTTHKHDTN